MFGWEFLLDAFWRMSEFRPRGLNGPDPLSPSLILDWTRLMGISLDSHDVKIIMAADRAFLKAEAEEAANRRAIEEAEAAAARSAAPRHINRTR